MRKLVFIATTLMPTAAYAGGYLLPNENARDLGLSQAAIADETGAEAVILNTAALAGQTGLDVSVSGELLVNRTDWSDPNLGSAKMNPQYNVPPAGAVSFGDKLSNGMAWGVGAGANVPAGGSIKWPTGWPGQEYVESVSQKIYGMAIGGAFSPTPYVKIGATYQRFQGEEELTQAINFSDHYGQADLGMSGGANSFGVAGEFKIPTIPLKLGITFVHNGDTTINGDVHFTGVPAEYTTLLHDQKVSEQLALPSVFNVGAAYRVAPHVHVMAAFTWEGWSVYHSDTFVGADGFSVVVPRNYNDAEVYRVAAEWEHPKFLPNLTLRIGGLRSISSQPTATVSPSLTDGDSWAFSLGAGYNVIPSLRVDIGYQHAFFDDVTASGIETLPGTYKTAVDLLSIGVNWRMDLLGKQPGQ